MNEAVEPRVWRLSLPDAEATAGLAHEIAAALKPGDFITLSGGLGAGKTVFIRAAIRALSHDPDIEIPSPTFTIIQPYDTPAGSVIHADLYRIGSPDELENIGWDDITNGAITFLEWPERIVETLPPDRLEVILELDRNAGDCVRQVSLNGYGSWSLRLQRIAAIGNFLRKTGWAQAERHFMLGDASSRRYERLLLQGKSSILMDSPARKPGPPVKFGRSYAEIAHSALDVTPFVALAVGLATYGFSAPQIIGMDLENGLLLLEDFGKLEVTDRDGPIPERYAAAIDVLVALHATQLPTTLPVGDKEIYQLPNFDRPAMEIEIELLLDWYFPHVGLGLPSQRMRDAFFSAWKDPLERVLNGPMTWLLRDYHSPNLMWLPDREGVRRVGLLDFQDAMIGSPAYDVAALTMDARVTVPEVLELQLVSRYVAGRRHLDSSFDVSIFARDYAIMGAQRLTKILGIFARLNRRDGKPSYLRHLPRVLIYLKRALAHPSLAGVREWYETHLFDHRGEARHDG